VIIFDSIDRHRFNRGPLRQGFLPLYGAMSGLGRRAFPLENRPICPDEVVERRPVRGAPLDAIPGRRKRLMFWEAEHDDWPNEAIRHTIDFIN
jgi:hypothetical protein